jgi:transcriptional regulator with XRE-family HTH domain
MEARDFIADLLAKGMTQVEIAERTGIRQSSISKVLTGKVNDVLSVSYRRLQALYDEKQRESKASRDNRQAA